MYFSCTGEISATALHASLSALKRELGEAGRHVVFERANHRVVALSRRMPQSILVDVPSGAFALDPPLPARERQLLGLVARIVAQPELHPAFQPGWHDLSGLSVISGAGPRDL